MLGGTPLASRGASSRVGVPEDGGWRVEVFESSSGIDIFFAERIDPSVSTREGLSLVGDNDLARSVLTQH